MKLPVCIDLVVDHSCTHRPVLLQAKVVQHNHSDLVMTIEHPKIKTIFIVGGPAGSGKTTVATYLAQELAIPYVEGDDVCSFLFT